MKSIKVHMLLVIGGICLLVAFGCTRLYKEQKEVYSSKMKYVQTMLYREKEWIRQNQGSEGQIYLNYTDNGAGDVNPYFACLAVQGVLAGEASPEDLELAKEYIGWHRKQLFGEQGKISNYRTAGGRLLSTKEKDSVDSYIAVFLSLLCRYGEQGGDLAAADPNGKALILGMGILDDLWVDGMTMVSYDNPVRYLMDNIEVQAALRDVKNYLEMNNSQWIPENKMQECIVILDKMIEESRISIEKQLWNVEEMRYDVGLDASGNILYFGSWENIYPDAAAQIYGAAFLQDVAESKRCRMLYGKFSDVHAWESMKLYEEEFDWAIFSYIAVAVEDVSRAERYLKEYDRRTELGREYPLHTAEAGWMAKACALLEDRYKEALNRNILEVTFDWIRGHTA